MSWQNSRRNLGIVLGILTTFVFVAAASRLLISLDSPIVVAVRAAGPAELRYEAEAGEVVSIFARSQETQIALDTVLEVRDPAGNQLAYRDDLVSEAGIETDAAIENLLLEEAGSYLILVDSFNGVSEGQVEVEIRRGDWFQQSIFKTENTTLIRGKLPADRVYRYELTVEVDSVWMFTARDLSGTLDPFLRVLDEAGELIMQNDDHDGSDFSLNTFDSRLVGVQLEAGRVYRIEIRDFLGRAGEFELSLIQEP